MPSIIGPIATYIRRLSAGIVTMRNHGANDLPRPLRLYRPDNLGMAYVWLDAADGVITLKVGNLGHPAECAQYDTAQWPHIREHLDNLRDMGFAEIPASEMAYLQITYPFTSDTADSDERARRDALIIHVTEHLAQTGQGHWADSATAEGRMAIGFHVVDFDIARATLTDLLDAGSFGNDLSIQRHAEPAFDNAPAKLETAFDNPAPNSEPEFQESAAQPARIRPRRVTPHRFADLAPTS